MRHRAGITLVEVLIAIFVMGIGMLALLVLFPVGALSMARAVKDDRCAYAGSNATALAIAFDLRNDSVVSAALDTQPAGFAATVPEGPSYPVYVDPFYADLNPSSPPPLGAAGTTPGLRRCSVAYGGGGLSAANQFFTLQDDMTFGKNGLPAANPIDRGGNYTWAYLVRRPQSGVKNVVDLTVVVYSGRSTLVQQGEGTFDAAGNAGETSVTLTWASGGTPPSIRAGGWILDTTYETVPRRDLAQNPLPGTAANYGIVHGHFYRVINVKETSGTSVVLELQQPLRANLAPTWSGKVVVMENVAEVFEKGTGWKP